MGLKASLSFKKTYNKNIENLQYICQKYKLEICGKLNQKNQFQKMQQKTTLPSSKLQKKNIQFLEAMMVEALKLKPKNPVNFCIKWLQKYEEQKKDKELSENEIDISDKEFQEKKDKAQTKGKKRSRLAISEQVFGIFNKKSAFSIPKKVEKSEQAKMLILSLIRNSILFQNVNSEYQNILIDSMNERLCQAGETLIREGDGGDVLYIVESGKYDCFKDIDGKETYLKTYQYGDSFGQLALMYNSPRAATIRVKQQGKLFTLDRQTFSYVAKQSNVRKRQLYQNILSKVQLLKELSNVEKQQFCDVLKEQKINCNDYVIKEGENGDKFYIVIEGKLVAEKLNQDGQNQVVYHYKEGEYFGELSLLNDISRQASVKALTPVKLVSVNRDSFIRTFGCMKDILQRNSEKYQKIDNKLVYC